MTDVLAGKGFPHATVSGRSWREGSLAEALRAAFQAGDELAISPVEDDDVWCPVPGRPGGGRFWTRHAVRRACRGFRGAARDVLQRRDNGDFSRAEALFRRIMGFYNNRGWSIVAHPPSSTVVGMIGPGDTWLGPSMSYRAMEEAAWPPGRPSGDVAYRLDRVDWGASGLRVAFVDDLSAWEGPRGGAWAPAVEVTGFLANGDVSARRALAGPDGALVVLDEGGIYETRGGGAEGRPAIRWPVHGPADVGRWARAMRDMGEWRIGELSRDRDRDARGAALGRVAELARSVYARTEDEARRCAARAAAYAGGGDVTAYDVFHTLAASPECGGLGHNEGARSGAMDLLRLAPLVKKKEGRRDRAGA